MAAQAAALAHLFLCSLLCIGGSAHRIQTQLADLACLSLGIQIGDVVLKSVHDCYQIRHSCDICFAQ